MIADDGVSIRARLAELERERERRFSPLLHYELTDNITAFALNALRDDRFKQRFWQSDEWVVIDHSPSFRGTPSEIHHYTAWLRDSTAKAILKAAESRLQNARPGSHQAMMNCCTVMARLLLMELIELPANAKTV